MNVSVQSMNKFLLALILSEIMEMAGFGRKALDTGPMGAIAVWLSKRDGKHKWVAGRKPTM